MDSSLSIIHLQTFIINRRGLFFTSWVIYLANIQREEMEWGGLPFVEGFLSHTLAQLSGGCDLGRPLKGI